MIISSPDLVPGPQSSPENSSCVDASVSQDADLRLSLFPRHHQIQNKARNEGDVNLLRFLQPLLYIVSLRARRPIVLNLVRRPLLYLSVLPRRNLKLLIVISPRLCHLHRMLVVGRLFHPNLTLVGELCLLLLMFLIDPLDLLISLPAPPRWTLKHNL